MKTFKYILLYFCVITYSCTSIFSQSIVWNGDVNSLLIGDKLEIFEDSTSLLTIQDIKNLDQKATFKPSSLKTINDPFFTGVYWLKFHIDNQTNEELYLEISQPILPEVQFYNLDSLGRHQVSNSGYNVKIFEKEVKHHLSVFPVYNKNSDILIRIQASGTGIHVRLWNKGHYEGKSNIDKLAFGIIIGFLLFVVLYNLFLYFSIRRKEYVLYSLIVFLYLVFAAVISGYLNYFVVDADLWQYYRYLPITILPLAQYYTLTFLDVKKYSPKTFKLSWFFIFYFLSYIVWFHFLDNGTAGVVSQIHSLIGIFIMAYTGIAVYRNGNKLGYYFAIAYFNMFILGSIEVIYNTTGKPSYLFGISYIVIGFLIEVIILSYLLSKRFEWERNESERSKTEAQAQLLEKTIENEKIVRDQNQILEIKVSQRTNDLKKVIEDLKSTQSQLIQSEKMASLGELTAGIAHEIQNPLNFVNNFSEVSSELVDEMNEELEKGNIDDAKEIAQDILQNLSKINFHGKRASSIVKGMLEHSRSSSGIKEPTDINDLCDEYLRLAYHGLRAKDKSFNAEIITKFNPDLPKIPVVSQDIGRVVLNLITNAFYAVNDKSKNTSPINLNVGSERDIDLKDFTPKVTLTTQLVNNKLEISVLDNGSGIPDAIKEKVFQPFFTTKPTGRGTGLGLSLSYDIVKAHGGELTVESYTGPETKTKGYSTKFTVSLPLQS